MLTKLPSSVQYVLKKLFCIRLCISDRFGYACVIDRFFFTISHKWKAFKEEVNLEEFKKTLIEFCKDLS